ncbi:helix-turn-helix transcriptional regulator [Streptomyces sp. NPDC057702]|uniref:helix-turn-helix domain-containing protein n=1 Tax=unclassified Streptomyces TaxID=2593676 RepID=UPI003681517B
MHSMGVSELTSGRREGEDMLARVASLTRRECEVLLRLSEGLPAAHMAHELCISERTVRAHVANIVRKLGVESRLQAALIGYRYRSDLLP